MSFLVKALSFQDPASFPFAPQKQSAPSKKVKDAAEARFKEIAELKLSTTAASRQECSLPLSNDPQKFFSKFKQYDHNVFQPHHIDLLRELMKKNILGGYVHFADLIGLDCLEILELSRLFLSVETYKDIEEAWITIYMQWIFGTLRVHLRNDELLPVSQYSAEVFVLGRSFLEMLSIFSESFYSEIDKELSIKLETARSKVIRDRLRAEAVKIPSIKTRWKSNIDLIATIMSSSDGGLLFFKTSLQHFYQDQPRQPSSIKQAQKSFAMLLRYCKLFEKGLTLSRVEGENIRFFQQISSAVDEVVKASEKGIKKATDKLIQELKDKEVYLEMCGQAMTCAAKTMALMLKDLPDADQKIQLHKNYEMQIFHVLLNYYSEVIIHKISASIDVTLMPQICQGHIPRKAWIDRAFNGVKSILEKDIPIALIQAAANICYDELEWKKQLSSLRVRYSLDIFENQQLLDYLEHARHEYGYLRLFFDKGVSFFSLELKKILSKNIQAYEKILLDFTPPIEDLVEETAWLAKLLFLQHDLHVLIGEHEPKDEEEILTPYLEVLDRVYYQPSLRSMELELIAKQRQLETDRELKELIDCLEGEDFSIGQVFSKPLHVKDKPADPHLEPKAQPSPVKKIFDIPKESAVGRFTKEEAEAFKHWKNASVRMVEKKLQEIGLQFLRQKGSHRQYGLVEDKTVRTTIAVHANATVHPSILRKIVHQVGVIDL